MGILRTLLALTVVFSHSYGSVFVGSRNAVQLFYMISGFLISYAIVEKKAYSDIKRFYINRYLRLYPIYAIVAVSTLILFVVAKYGFGNDGDFFPTYQNAPFLAKVLLVFSNTFLFLQDWVQFSGVENSQLVFSTNFKVSEVILYKGLLVPQAWTLGVELSFYLIAPFVLTKRKALFTLLTLSLLLRMYLFRIGIGNRDPWAYRFFPAELSLFLLGALSHQFILPLLKETFPGSKIQKYSTYTTYIFVVFTVVYWPIPLSEAIKTTLLFVLFVVLLPLFFVFQSTREWDRRIGELSYPIYISHSLVVYVVSSVMNKLQIHNPLAFGLISVVLTMFLSAALNSYIGVPVEALRAKFRDAA